MLWRWCRPGVMPGADCYSGGFVKLVDFLRGLSVRASGGSVPRRTPRPGEQLTILSPGRQITDPDEAEALGLPADARRMRRERGRS